MCEVAVQEPFLYTKVYALETYRFLNSNTIGLHPSSESAQAHYTFLNECDHIKVTVQQFASISTLLSYFYFVFLFGEQSFNSGASSLAFVYLRLSPAQFELFRLWASVSSKTSIPLGQLFGRFYQILQQGNSRSN